MVKSKSISVVSSHTPQQLPSGLALHQQAADELGGNLLGGAGEEGWGEVTGGRGGYGGGLGGEMGGGYWEQQKPLNSGT